MVLEFLKGIASSFERSRWLKLHVYYKPAVGTTQGGLVSIGTDFAWAYQDDAGKKKISRSIVRCLTPSITHSVWEDSQRTPLRVPKNMLMSRLWYTHSNTAELDAAPCDILFAVDISSPASADLLVGEIFIDYSLEFEGTKIP